VDLLEGMSLKVNSEGDLEEEEVSVVVEEVLQ